jgi:hypothetical protein
MWTLIITLHAVNLNVPPSKGSIHFRTASYEECVKTRDSIKQQWSSNQYRVSASCVLI